MAKSNWVLDPTHSEVGFKVKHMMFTNVSGKFNEFTATITNENDDFSLSQIVFEAKISSIDTGNAERDNHLKSADFFDAENFEIITFRASTIEKHADENYTITGDLTIKDTTKPIKLKLAYSGLLKDPWGNTKIAVSVEGKINRKDFGLTWNAALETGGVLVGEEVKLEAEIQFVKQ